MDIPLPDNIPLPQEEEDTHESEQTSDSPTKEPENISEESNLENSDDIQKNVSLFPSGSSELTLSASGSNVTALQTNNESKKSDPSPSNPIAIQPNFSVAPPNQLVPPPKHDMSKPQHSLGMFTAGGLPNLNQPPPPFPQFSQPPPGFPPLNQPPPGMMPFSQPPPSILDQLKRPPPPPVLKNPDTSDMKSIINESETASTQERYSPSRVTADDDETPATEVGVGDGAQGAEEGLQEKKLNTQNINATDKKVTKNVSKVRLPSVFGKAEAKKRLLAFSGKTSFNISKTSKVTAGSVLEENEEAEKSAKKPTIAVAKKKKEEKKSMIEHIRDEETRIKEAIGLKQFNMPFSLYGPGLFPIQKLLDNPEELKKFEEKCKGMPDRLAAYEQKEKKRAEEKEKDKERERQREKDKRRERESGRSKDSENEKSKNSDKRNEDDDIKRKPKFIPKNWREFKDNNITFEDIQQIFREKQENRSRDYRRQSFTNDIEAKLMFPLRVKSKNRGVVDKEFPAHMICNTNTKPHLAYSINPSRYRAHFLTRYEIKQHKSLESWTLLKEFWNSNRNFSAINSANNEGIESREWYEASWNIESICARADAQDVKNREEADIAIKSRWDSDNEVEENASQNEEIIQKSSAVNKKVSRKEEGIEYKKGKDVQFSEGLNEEYDLFLKSLDDEGKKLEKKTTKEKKVEDDSKDNENMSNDIDEEVTGENMSKDKDSGVSDSVEPNNELNIKKKKNKKLKKQQKDNEKKKKKEEKKAKKKAKKAKKKLKKQKEKNVDNRGETSDIESQENEEYAIKSSPSSRNTSCYDENSGSWDEDDEKYDDDSWSKYHQEKLSGGSDSRYTNSICKNDEKSPYRNESREFYEDQLENDEKQVSRDRPNDDYYEDEYTSSREDKSRKRNSNPLAYERDFIKEEYPKSSRVSEYESDEFEHKYSKENFSNSKDEYRKMHRNLDESSKHSPSNYDRKIFKERGKKDILSDNQKEFKEISNKLERYICEDDYDRTYNKKHRNDLEGKSYAEKESHYSRYDYKLRKDEMDYRNKEKSIHKDLGGSMEYDSENDEKYNNSYSKCIPNRSVRKKSELSHFSRSSKFDKFSEDEFNKADRLYKNDDLQYLERYVENESRNSDRLDKKQLRDVESLRHSSSSHQSKTIHKSEIIPPTTSSHKSSLERKSEYLLKVDQIPMPSNAPPSEIPLPIKASEDCIGIPHRNYRSHKELGSYGTSNKTVNEVQEFTDEPNDKSDGHKTQIRKGNLPVAFKLSGTKYSGQQYKPHPGFSVEDEQENVSEVSNNDLEDEESEKEDHVFGSLADTFRVLRQVGPATSDKKNIEKKKEKKNYNKSKDNASEDSYQCEEDSIKWKDKYQYQKSSGRSHADMSLHKDPSPEAEQHYSYEGLQRSRSPEEDKRRYRSHSPSERSPRLSSPRSSQTRKTRSPIRSSSPTREVSPTEESKYTDKNHPSYDKSPDHKIFYEDRRSKYFDDKRKASKYQNFEDTHHHGEQNEFEHNYLGTPEHSSYESYSVRKEKYGTEREHSPAFIDFRHKHMSPDYSSRGGYERKYDREQSPNLDKQRHKHSLSSDSWKFKSDSRENLSEEELLNSGYYSSEEDDKNLHFKHSRNSNSDRKEREFNSGYSNTNTEMKSISESKGSDRKRPNSSFKGDFKEHERYKSEIEESPNRRERNWYDERASSHDREFYRCEVDKNIDRKETYKSRSEYRSPETSRDRSLSPNRRYRESGDAYNSSDEIEREINKVITRSPVRRDLDQRSRSSDMEENEFTNFSNNHSKRKVKEQYSERIDNRDGKDFYDHYVSSPNRKERFYVENRNKEKGSYNYHREDAISPEINHLENKQTNSLQHESKQRNYSPESYSHIRKHSYREYSTSPNRCEYIRPVSPSSTRISKQQLSESREESPSQKSISTSIKSSSPTSRSKSPPTHIKSTAKRSISPRPKSPSPKVQRSPRRISELSNRRSRSPSITSRMYSPSRSQSPNRRISQSPNRMNMQTRSPHGDSESPIREVRSPSCKLNSPRSRLPNKEILSTEVRLSSPSSMSRSPQRRISRSPYRSPRSPQRRISRSPQRRLSASPQRLSRSPCRKTRSPCRRSSVSPSKRSMQSHYGRISPHSRLSPQRRYSRSPNRRLSRSPQRRLSRSPPRRLSRSPQRRLSRSPQRISRSPHRRVSRSPHRRLSRSPNKISYSPERGLSRSPLRRYSKSPERPIRSPNLSSTSPLRIDEPTSIASIINFSREFSNIKHSDDDDVKHTSRIFTKIPLPEEYEKKRTQEQSKIPLPDDHGGHGSMEHTKLPLPDNKERQGAREYSKIHIPIIHDEHEATEQSLNESNWTWDEEKKNWLPNSSEVFNTNKHNENEDKVSDNKISLCESAIKIDADSTISDSELAGHQESPVTRESSSSPHESPRRLTLDERLKQEHGVTVQEDKPANPPMNQLYKWGYPVQASQVIQVGNMLEILPQYQSTISQASLIEQVTNSSKSGEILASPSSSTSPNGLVGQQQDTVTSTENVSLPTNLALINSSIDKVITSQALITLNVLSQETIQKYTQIDPQVQANSALLNPDVNMIAREQLKQKRRELKERRRQEREVRREKRRLRALELAHREAIIAASENEEEIADDAEEEALIREAMFETPNLGSPVPDYEVIDEDEEEKEEEARERRQKRLQPVPLPPAADKGILMSPSYRARDDYHLKTVKFADGILPGEGTSPSGGEEIHSPPPPTIQTSKSKEKKLRKKRRVKIKMIKQYGVGADEEFSPPPPPPGDPVFSVKLFPGFDHHYKASATGAAIIYTQPVLHSGVGGVIGVPGVPVVGFSRLGDADLLGTEDITSPSVTMSPSGPVVPTTVTFQLPTGCAYNAESMQYIHTTSSTQPTASTLVDTNLSKK